MEYETRRHRGDEREYHVEHEIEGVEHARLPLRHKRESCGQFIYPQGHPPCTPLACGKRAQRKIQIGQITPAIIAGIGNVLKVKIRGEEE